jgi:hypothetical protein
MLVKRQLESEEIESDKLATPLSLILFILLSYFFKKIKILSYVFEKKINS